MAPFPLYSALAHDLKRFANYPCLISADSGHRYTFSGVERKVKSIAGQLLGSGVIRGERVAVISKTRPEGVLTVMACWSIGVVPCVIDANLPILDTQNIIELSKTSFVIVDDPSLEKVVNNTSFTIMNMQDDWRVKQNAPKKASDAKVHPETVLILFTSGTGGTYRPVMLSSVNILSSADAIAEGFDLRPTEIAFNFLPFQHIASLSYWIFTMRNGMASVLLAQIDPATLPLLLQKYKPHTLGTVPRLLEFFLIRIEGRIKDLPPLKQKAAEILHHSSRIVRRKLDIDIGGILFKSVQAQFGGRLKYVYCGSALLNHNTEKKLRAFGFQIYQGYGLTETTSAIVGNKPKHRKIDSAGRINSHHHIKIINSNASGEGEICVKGPMVTLGYFGDVEATKESFKEGWFHTGDLGRLDDHGYLMVTGRIKEIIVHESGKKAMPQEIEEKFSTIPGIKELAVVGIPKYEGGPETVHAAIILDQDYLKKGKFESIEKEIRDAIRKRNASLPFHLHIVTTHFLDEIPKTTTLKVRRKDLRDILRNTKPAFSAKRSMERRQSSEDTKDIEDMKKWLVAWLQKNAKYNLDELDGSKSLSDFHLDSLLVMQLFGDLTKHLNRKVNPAVFWEQPTVDRLILALLQKEVKDDVDLATQATRPQIKEDSLAIIGVGLRFVGGNKTPEQFWSFLKNGDFGITIVPKSRWDNEVYFDADPNAPGKTSTQFGGFLDDIDHFDADFFGIGAQEAAFMDPQHRIFLTVVWEALENAGIDPLTLKGSKTGVFAGISNMDYANLMMKNLPDHNISPYLGIGSAMSALAGRVSYFLGLEGPCMSIDTACSSSLVAVHQARLALARGEIDLAIVGGVNIILNPGPTISFSKAGMMAADGKCKTFDASADGYVRSEGCGVVILKATDAAKRDRDNIWAIIKGSSINQDGASQGITAPNGDAQIKVYRQALAEANIEAAKISYIEAHGTGTKLGDPIEVRSLGAVYKQGRTSANPLLIGSVKTNIGHMEAAAGIGGLIKAALVLHHREVPGSLHFKQLNPLITLEDIPAAIPTAAMAITTEEAYAAVSSFGFTGTNAHVVLEAVKQSQANSKDNPGYKLIVLSAKSVEALSGQIEKMKSFLESTQLPLASISYTLQTSRSHFRHRFAAVAKSIDEMKEKLSAEISFNASVVQRGKVAFMFTGQGSQYSQMGQDLLESFPKYKSVFQSLIGTASSKDGYNFRDILFDPKLQSKLDLTQHTQPALYLVELCLARLLESWGIKPDYLIGHSVGEIVAASFAGIMSDEQGFELIQARGDLMGTLDHGWGMAQVSAGQESVAKLIQELGIELDIAVINSLQKTVVAGKKEDLARFENACIDRYKFKKLAVSHAFHSRQMDPICDQFTAISKKFSYNKPQYKVVSNLDGELIESVDAKRWTQHLRQAVQFAKGLQKLYDLGVRTFIEIGPDPVLINIGRDILASEDVTWIQTMKKTIPATQTVLEALGAYYKQGFSIDWLSFNGDAHMLSKERLPTYAFQESKHWVKLQGAETMISSPNAKGVHAFLAKDIRLPSHLNSKLFHSLIEANSPAYLQDHRLYGNVVVAGASYLSAAISYMAKNRSRKNFILSANFFEPLVFIEDQAMLLETAATRVQNLEQIRFSSKNDGGADAERFFAQVDVDTSKDANATTTLHSGFIANMSKKYPLVKGEELYARGERIQYTLGEKFRWVIEAYVGTNEILAKLRPRQGFDPHDDLPAGMIDSFFHPLLAFLGEKKDEKIAVPLSLQDFHFNLGQDPAWILFKIKNRKENTVICELQVFDKEEKVIAQCHAITFKEISQRQIESLIKKNIDINHGLYEDAWLAAPLASSKEKAAKQSNEKIIVMANKRENLPSELINIDNIHIIGFSKSELEKVFHSNASVVLFWGDEQKEHFELPTLNHSQRYLSLVTEVFKALTNLNFRGQVTFFTQKSCRVFYSDSVSLAMAPISGYVRSLAIEIQQFSIRQIDLDSDLTLDIFKAEIGFREANEVQVAYRDGDRFAPRMMPQIKAIALRHELTIPEGNYHLVAGQKGQIKTLRLQNDGPISELGQREVVVEVKASALNFRDVLIAMGLYPDEEAQIGGDFAGVVSKIGTEVDYLKVGDKVMGIAPKSMGNSITIPAVLCVPFPEAISPLDAATIPGVFLTVHYALTRLYKPKKGDVLLLHSAAGGIGLAALQYAKIYGLKVVATAGNERKRDYLHGLGVKHVFDSRSHDYAAKIRQTVGEVDVVLNFLTADFIATTLSVMKKDGCFLEIGKRDIYSHEKMAEVRPDLKYHIIAIDQLIEEKPEYTRDLLLEISEEFRNKHLAPLPRTTFPLKRAVEAFEFLARAKQIGKVVIDTGKQKEKIFSSQGSYIITGGLGAIGLFIAGRLVSAGARRIVLVGRSKANQMQLKQIAAITNEKATIEIANLDVADSKALQNLFSSTQDIRGVFHCAGVLDDKLLVDQNQESFAKVWPPKVTASYLMLHLLKDKKLDFFMNFSSIAASIGSPGQLNYAAANSFFDSLYQDNIKTNFPILNINWGPWADGGMAGDLSKQFAARGVKEIYADEGWQVICKSIIEGRESVSYVQVDWAKMLGLMSKPSLLFSKVAVKTNSSVERIDLAQVKSSELKSVIRKQIVAAVVNILGLDSENAIEDERPLLEYGMDSLMAMQLFSEIRRRLTLDKPINPQIMGDNLSVALITKGLLDLVISESGSTTVATTNRLVVLKKAAGEVAGRLVCFPQAGGGPSQFYKWGEQLPADIELLGVQLPLLGERKEKTFTLDSMAMAIAEEYAKLSDVPTLFFGHSMGTILAFETLHALHKRNKNILGFMVSGLNSPKIVGKDDTLLIKRNREVRNQLVREHLRALASENTLDEKELFETYQPLIDSDFSILENYRYVERERLNCNIQAIGGLEDTLYQLDGLLDWGGMTSGSFAHEQIAGDHFYHSSELLQDKVLQFVAKYLGAIQVLNKAG